MPTFYKLMPSLLFSYGYNRTVIIDFQRKGYNIVSNDLYQFALKINEKSENFVKSIIAKNELYSKYFKYLIQNEYLLICDSKNELSFFPHINIKFEVPFEITNALLDDPSLVFIDKAVELLESINVPFVQIRFFKKGSISQINDVLALFQNSSFKSVEVIMDRTLFENDEEIREFLKRNIRICSLILYNSLGCSMAALDPLRLKKIFKINRSAKKMKRARVEDETFFLASLELYSESIEYHSYFNKKIYLDPNGLIKNAPELEANYGNVLDLSTIDFGQIIRSAEFQKFWKVSKDKCLVCRDCEFRHVCVDNRVPTKNNKKTWHHKKECNYNPYLSKWKGEEGYKSLSKTKVFKGL